MKPQQTNQGQPHVFFSTILFYPKPYYVTSSIDMFSNFFVPLSWTKSQKKFDATN